MQKHYYEVSFTSRFALSETDEKEIEQFITDLLTPEYEWETTSVNYIDSEGYDD